MRWNPLCFILGSLVPFLVSDLVHSQLPQTPASLDYPYSSHEADHCECFSLSISRHSSPFLMSIFVFFWFLLVSPGLCSVKQIGISVSTGRWSRGFTLRRVPTPVLTLSSSFNFSFATKADSDGFGSMGKTSAVALNEPTSAVDRMKPFILSLKHHACSSWGGGIHRSYFCSPLSIKNWSCSRRFHPLPLPF